jgi:hypothetical protein
LSQISGRQVFATFSEPRLSLGFDFRRCGRVREDLLERFGSAGGIALERLQVVAALEMGFGRFLGGDALDQHARHCHGEGKSAASRRYSHNVTPRVR